MSSRGATALLLLFLAVGATAQKPAVPKASESKFRTRFAAALADPRGKDAKDLAADAKSLAEKHGREAVVALLRRGPEIASGEPKPRKSGKETETLRRFDRTIVGFTFKSGGATYRYAVDLPKEYDPAKPAPLLVDPGHGSGAKLDDKGKADFLPFYRRAVDQSGQSDALVARTEIIEQIGAGGLAGERPEEEIVRVFDAFFHDAAGRFAIDPERVVVAGLSQTGYWAWYLGQTRADRLCGIVPMSAVTWQTNGYHPNLANLAMYVLHGDKDVVCPVAQPRATTKALEALGARVHYEEIADAGHDAKVWMGLAAGLEWLFEKPRPRAPKKIAKNLQTLADPWCHWARIDALASEGNGKAAAKPTATFEAAVDGQTITVTSEGVKRLTLALNAHVLDLTKPVRVLWNAKEVASAPPKLDLQKTIAAVLERADWAIIPEAFIELE